MDEESAATGSGPFDPEVAREPRPFYARMRQEGISRFHFGEHEAVFLTRYEDVHFALRHPEIFSSAMDAVSIGQKRPLIPLQIDPPEHAKYRRILDPQFSPGRVAAMDADARKLVNEIVDRFVDDGECNFHTAFAVPLPCTLFLRIMGLPLEHLDRFLAWKDGIIRPDVPFGDLEAAERVRNETGEAIYAYFEEAIAQREHEPDDGLLTSIMHAEVEGRRMSTEEVLDTCYLFLLGGLDTVTATLDCSIAYLARHPDQRRRLVEDPSSIAGAVEELLRYETPVTGVPRIVTQDVEMHGVQLRAGDHVTVVLGAADTDSTEFPDADSVDFDRQANRHFAFGGGPHRCLGSHLARFELQVALEEWHRRIPDYRVKDGVELDYSPGIREVAHLPLVFEAS
ncbi:MAG: cytochrome P450 [Acidimicrobiia bacterium]|nr:cytochrome P450 [Acidimicrobiia bacterium]